MATDYLTTPASIAMMKTVPNEQQKSIAADIARELDETPRRQLTVRTENGDDIYQAKIRKRKIEEK
jgi:hypothetical protein